MAVTITSVAPGYGKSGDDITITGNGFANTPSKTLVYRRTDNGTSWVNVAAANVAYVSATQLTVTLTAGAPDSWEPGLNDIGVAVYAATPPASPDAFLADAIYYYIAATLAIDATLAGAAANSYLAVAEADAYFATRLNATAWATATPDQKAQALIMACRAIGRLRIRCHRVAQGLNDQDQVYQSDQALPFPRWRDRDDSGDVIVPQPVKDAQCEEALALLGFGEDASRRARLQSQGVASITLPGVSEQYRDGAQGQPLASAEAIQLLRPYIAGGAVIATSTSPVGEWTPGSVM